MRRPRIFYGWWIVVAGVVINMLMGGLVMHAFGFYASALKEEFLWSATTFSLALALTRVESGVLGPIQGWMIDRFGPQSMMRLGIASTAIGLLAFSQLWDAGSFIGFYFIVAVGTSIGGFMTVSVATVHWFERKRSRALGYMSTGFALGALMAPVVNLIINEVGWRWMAIGSAVFLFVVGQALAFMFVGRPQEKGLLPDGGPEPGPAGEDGAAGAPQRRRDFTIKETLRTRAFWALALAHGAPLMVVGGVMSQYVLRVEEIPGLTNSHAAIGYTVMTVCQLIGQIGGGYLGEIISKRWIVGVCMVGHLIGAVLLGFADTFAMVVLFAIINGLAWGARAPLISALRADYFGASAFGRIMGFSSLVMMIFMTAGVLLAGILRDLLGDYTIAFTVLGIGAGTGIIWTMMAARPQLPQRRILARVPAPVLIASSPSRQKQVR